LSGSSAATGVAPATPAAAVSAGTRASEAPATTESAAPAAAESAGARTAVPAGSRRTTGPAILSGPRFADREGTAHEQLAVEFLDRFFGGGALGVLDERKASRAAGLAIKWANDLGWLTDLRKMRSQVFFGRLIGQIAHEQSDWWHG
jgi:hypothetical protein